MLARHREEEGFRLGTGKISSALDNKTLVESGYEKNQWVTLSKSLDAQLKKLGRNGAIPSLAKKDLN